MVYEHNKYFDLPPATPPVVVVDHTHAPQLAVMRLVKYWDERIKLFGPEKAFLPLTQSCALKDDEVALGMAFMRLTGTTDASGRSIIFADPSKLDPTKYSRESMARTVWYTIHAALEDDITQRKGVVFVVYPHNAKLSQFDRKLAMMNMSSMQGRLPVRLGGFHVVRPPSFFSVVFGVIRLFMHDRVKKRVVVHTGSEAKVLESLAKKGLSPNVLPVDIGGSVIMDQQKWLKSRRQEEPSK